MMSANVPDPVNVLTFLINKILAWKVYYSNKKQLQVDLTNRASS